MNPKNKLTVETDIKPTPRKKLIIVAYIASTNFTSYVLTSTNASIDIYMKELPSVLAFPRGLNLKSHCS